MFSMACGQNSRRTAVSGDSPPRRISGVRVFADSESRVAECGKKSVKQGTREQGSKGTRKQGLRAGWRDGLGGTGIDSLRRRAERVFGESIDCPMSLGVPWSQKRDQGHPIFGGEFASQDLGWTAQLPASLVSESRPGAPDL